MDTLLKVFNSYGPYLPFGEHLHRRGAARQSCRSCMLQHFRQTNDRSRDASRRSLLAQQDRPGAVGRLCAMEPTPLTGP